MGWEGQDGVGGSDEKTDKHTYTQWQLDCIDLNFKAACPPGTCLFSAAFLFISMETRRHGAYPTALRA